MSTRQDVLQAIAHWQAIDDPAAMNQVLSLQRYLSWLDDPPETTDYRIAAAQGTRDGGVIPDPST